MFDGVYLNPEFNIVGMSVSRFEEYDNRGNLGRYALLIHLYLMYYTVGMGKGHKIKVDSSYFQLHTGLNCNQIKAGVGLLVDMGVVDSFEVTEGRYVFNTISSSVDQVLIEILDCWNAEKIQQHKIEVFVRRVKKKHRDIIKEIGLDAVKKAIRNYASVVKGEEYFFNYRWSLWEFIGRENGILNFVDEMEPLVRYRKNKTEEKEQTVEDIYG